MGRKFPTLSPPPGLARTRSILLGRFDQPSVRSLLDARHLAATGIGEQGYVLDVEPNQVLVAGKDSAGLFYGVQTLRQLVVRNGQDTEIVGVRVRDWPTLPHRGTKWI